MSCFATFSPGRLTSTKEVPVSQAKLPFKTCCWLYIVLAARLPPILCFCYPKVNAAWLSNPNPFAKLDTYTIITSNMASQLEAPPFDIQQAG